MRSDTGLKSRIEAAAAALFPQVRAIREHLHAHPELSFVEYQTSGFVAGKLEEWGIEHTRGWGGTGIVALLKGGLPAEKDTCTAVRAELDALPISEDSAAGYCSRNKGVMHACGHDAHTACLLGAARILQQCKEAWSGTLKLIFQPGEEKHPGGGSLLLAEGVLQNPTVDRILALHVYPTLPAGVVGFREGKYMASTDEIHITIRGKGGHAALPHQTIDPISIAAEVITALQQIVSRRSNPVVPCVLSFGHIAGGTANNIIPDTVTLSGTLRTMDEDWRAEAHRLIEKVTTSVCESWGATAEITIPKGYPSLYNNPALTVQASGLAKEYLGAAQVRVLDLRMTADDFAFYSHKIPGCYFRLGTAAGEKYGHSVHTAQFDISAEALKTGSGLLAYLVASLNREAVLHPE